jgi:hypothetical protein
VNTRLKKLIASVVLIKQVAQTFTMLKTQSKIIFNVGCLHVAPSMAIVLLPFLAFYSNALLVDVVVGVQIECCHRNSLEGKGHCVC